MGDASVCVRLNTKARKENGQCPVCLCVYRQGTRSFIRAGVWADDAEFDAICLAGERVCTPLYNTATKYAKALLGAFPTTFAVA